jgi:hypothetical protein
MHHFATALCAGLLATAVVGGATLTPTPAEAAKTPSAEAVALKETTAACRAQAKEKKIRWPTSRKFVSDCVAKAVKLTPAELQKIAVKQLRARRRRRAKRSGGPRAGSTSKIASQWLSKSIPP